jgi:hypothetical protein
VWAAPPLEILRDLAFLHDRLVELPPLAIRSTAADLVVASMRAGEDAFGFPKEHFLKVYDIESDDLPSDSRNIRHVFRTTPSAAPGIKGYVTAPAPPA